MINVLLADPDVLAREGFKHMLSAHPDIGVIAEASSLEETLRALRDSAPHVCLLEVTIARHAGLGILREVKRHATTVPLLAMGHCHERDFALRAMRAGAVGYLPKDCTGEQLAAALKAASQSRPYISEMMCELIVESIVEERPKRQHDMLSDTDFDLFCLIAEGLPLATIAGICNVSLSALRARRNRIMAQMSLHSETELVEYAISRKLIGHVHSGG